VSERVINYSYQSLRKEFSFLPQYLILLTRVACDSFTMFLAKNHPLHSEVYESSGGYLGIGSVPNVIMFAYSATYNELYVCNW